jgi:hypothetical protein
MSRNQRHIVSDSAGGWSIKAPGASRSSGHFNTQAQAISRAREILQNSGGGELITHGEKGRIRESDTIPPAHDAFPPRG